MPASRTNRLPPLHALAAFEAVARLHSFARAADELCVTHGAISHRIKALEAHFGARLFVRRGGSVMLTTQGIYFLSAVVDALAILQRASKRLTNARGVVTISAGPSTAHNWLVPRLGAFYREHPDIDLEITATKLALRKKRATLETGEADVMIRYGRKEDWSGFEAVKLMDVTLFPVCAPAFLERMGSPDTAEAFRKATLLRLPHEPWKPWFTAAGIDRDEPDSGPVFGDASILLDAAANAQGVALARDVLVERDIAAGRLVRIWRVAIPSPSAYFAVWSPRSRMRPEVKAFIEWLTASCR
jgi:LysR family glycine cleavage system transcriptional activator